MREKMRSTLLALAGIAALTGGAVVATDTALAKKGGKHAKKRSAAQPAALTGDSKTQAEAAALAAVPGGTVKASFAAKAGNPDGAAYVVRLTDADGDDIAVLEDASFTVLRTAAGRPPCGGAGPAGGERRGPEPLTGDTKTQAEAAALAAVPGGQVGSSHAARPDNPDGAVYAVDVETADDEYVVVLEDASFGVIKVVAAPPRRGGGPRPPHDEQD
jgi:uncharacterized membrane protein YkoI